LRLQRAFVNLTEIKKANLVDWIYFLRPLLHPPVWTIVLLGFFRSPVKPESDTIIIWMLLISSGLAGWAYIINQIADVETDKQNKKLYFLPLEMISEKAAYISAILIGVATLSGAFYLDIKLGYINLFGLILGFLYSAKPFFGKNRPILGTLLNGVGHGSVVFIIGYVVSEGPLASSIINSLPYFFAVIAVFIGTTLPDIDGDKKTGKRTPAVALGISNAVIMMLAALMLCQIFSLVLWDMPLLIVSNLCMPFYIYAALKKSVKAAVLAARTSVLFLSLAACYFLWQYAILLILLFIASRIYYKRRFNISYPKLV